MPLLEYLEGLQPKPQYAQTAVGGTWEEAVRIDFDVQDQTAPFQAGSVDSSVAGEIFYRLNDDRMLFLGLRYSAGLTNAATPELFLQKLTDIMKMAGQSSLGEVLVKLGQDLNGEPNTYLGETIDYVELGVENYWKSMGSLKLRDKENPPSSLDELEKLLNHNQNLMHNSKNHTALEFAIRNPEYWFGLQVSRKVGDTFVTDMKLLAELVNLI